MLKKLFQTGLLVTLCAFAGLTIYSLVRTETVSREHLSVQENAAQLGSTDNDETEKAVETKVTSLEYINVGDVRGYVIQELPFTYNGVEGEVIHVCDGVVADTLHDRGKELICLGDNVVSVQFDGDSVELAQFASLTVADTQTLAMIDVVDSSETLLVSLYNNNCIGAEGLCIREARISHAVTLRTMEVRALNHEMPYFFSFDQLVWNNAGTKAVMAVGCPEGCPKEKYYGYNLKTDTATLLLIANDLGSSNSTVPLVSSVHWLDDETAAIEDRAFTF